ncbi:CubicO group peptidase (beta-lactamase class C family) [Xanthomonas arboricola]|uniref:serine hydrolase domain-containing protein n=1 Tax=Xanthomonas TaxID=338 RepID=UPI00181755E6|nr:MULTISPECIES: serine hydrolase domain-containing protein [Xanthomonas]MBB5737119.1 CubicO group peptidase (beta-lactamase class C family) [Xanthomonas sp. CFBP 8152]
MAVTPSTTGLPQSFCLMHTMQRQGRLTLNQEAQRHRELPHAAPAIGRLLQTVLLLSLWLPLIALADESIDKVTQQMQLNRQRYGIVGQAAYVSHNGKVLFRGGDGLADLDSQQPVMPEQIFPMFSVSKLLVSTLIMQLVEAGQIGLDRPARVYLPDLPRRWSKITVRQLLNHTSGLPEYFTEAQMSGAPEANASFPATAHAVFAALGSQPLLFPPGSNTRYINTNYLVLSQLLQTHYRKPYSQIVSERILEPLKLAHTFLGRSRLPADAVVSAYVGKDGKLQKEPEIAWPDYALGHAELYASIDDLATFIEAMRDGKLVGKPALRQLWQPQLLTNGQRGWFASGWEVGASGAYRHVGHDGGARVRVRLLFADALDGDSYTIVYLTNGSTRGVWSRVLVDSIMATIAPQTFPAEALSEKLIAFALQSPVDHDTQLLADALRVDGSIPLHQLEAVVNATGYTVLSNLGADAAIRVFALNVLLFPASRNALDSLAEAYEASGDLARSSTIRQSIKGMAAPPEEQ